MATVRPVLIVLLLALVCFYSCDDDDTPTGGDGTIEYPFPNAVGMLWKYKVYDSLAETTDTVWVSVTDSVMTRCGYTSYRWRLNWVTRDSVVDRFALAWVDSTMVEFFTDSTYEPMMLERFVFPLEDGAQWTAPYGADTSRVFIMRSVTVPAGTFRRVALVERVWNPDFEGGGNWSETWLAENAGIVKRHFLSRYSDGTTIYVTLNQTWELIDYDLTTFNLSQFPNTVGTEWVYELVQDKLDATFVDTVTVTIIDHINMSYRDSATVWEFVGDEYTDTIFVAVSGSDVFEMFDTLAVMPFLSWTYRFPMAVGRHWGFDYFAPVPIVEDKAAVITPAGCFPTGFHYIAAGGGELYISWVVDDWLVPGVGVVKRTFLKTYDGPVIIQKWTLLSYEETP